MTSAVPRILLAAPWSGSGKTSLTCALIGAFSGRGLVLSSFKCGPDYIDPMFHREVLGKASSNLDLFLMGGEACRRLLAERSEGSDLALIEGVMGYYDGVGTSDRMSSYHLARETGTPAVLVVDCHGAGVSLAAAVKGLQDFRRDSGLRGVVFNRIRPALYGFYRTIVEGETSLAVLGYMPDMPECCVGSRHLGLITAEEVEDLKGKMERLAAQASRSVDLDGILRIASSAAGFESPSAEYGEQHPVRIAWAMDEAFCFYYEDSLAVLQKMGAELVPFSPLRDRRLPACDGLILGGGYPELHLEELSANRGMLDDVRSRVGGGLPCIAECGGFMYLHERLRGVDGREHRMAGLVPGTAYMTGALKRFGYATLTARRESLLCPEGGSLSVHEFHYSDSTSCGDGFEAVKPGSGERYDCIVAGPAVHVGYPHIHFMGNAAGAARFLKTCEAFKESAGGRQAAARKGDGECDYMSGL